MVWEEKTEEECLTSFVKKCEQRARNICEEVIETRCEIVPYTECSVGLEHQHYHQTELIPKKFTEKACTQGTQTIQHQKLLPECRNVTKHSCSTLWVTDYWGRKGSAGKESCEPVTWEECKLVAKDVKFILPLVTCSDKQDIWYHQYEQIYKTVTTNTHGCKVPLKLIKVWVTVSKHRLKVAQTASQYQGHSASE